MRVRTSFFVRIAIATALLLALVAATIVADRLARAEAVDGVTRRARSSAILLAATLRRELEKFRLVPVVLADDREARDALLTRAPDRLAALNRKLEALSDGTDAANVYLLDATGRTVAASNWRRPESFVGDDYSFRAYYRDAMRAGSAQQFALGQRSRQPGLYISKRIAANGRTLGVIVVKVDFHALEREWRETTDGAFVTDARGIILIAAEPSWQFQTTRPLSAAERTRARRSFEYGAVPLVQNRLYAGGAIAPAGGAAARSTRFVEAVEQVGGGWRVHALAPVQPAIDAAIAYARLALAIAVIALGGAVLLWRYRRRRLAAEIEAQTNARLAGMRDQLVQANKLATLGQVTAGVGHEINQPVAAIAAYAHNARTLVARDQASDAVEALDRIVALTQRIGLITRELRGFARRSTGEMEPVAVDEAIEGIAMLLRDRLRMLDAVLITTPSGQWVRAEKVRLEQVLVNLVQNALEAGARTITAGVTAVGDRVEIAIADDGPGLSDAMRAALFQPFTTSKKDGLGLGLVICHDIVKDFGGTLKPRAPAEGTEFVIDLERVT